MADEALKRLGTYGKGTGRWVIAALESVQESHGSGRQDPGWFHPSGLGDPCDAKLAFAFLGAPAIQNIGARTQRIFDNGSGRDAYLKSDMARSGISLIKTEEDRAIVLPALYIRGELDDWIENPITKEQFIVDYKTMRSELYNALEATKPEHHIQIHPYMFAKGTRRGFVLYENKDTQEQKCLPADFEQESIWQKLIVDRITRIIEGLNNGYVFRTPVSCSQCPYFSNGVCGANDIDGLKKASGLYK